MQPSMNAFVENLMATDAFDGVVMRSGEDIHVRAVCVTIMTGCVFRKATLLFCYGGRKSNVAG